LAGFLVADFFQAAELAVARIVHHHVEPAERAGSGFEGLAHAFLAAQVQAQG
jgi:hypothetical protein